MPGKITSVRGLSKQSLGWLRWAKRNGLEQAEVVNAAFDALAVFLAREYRLTDKIRRAVLIREQAGDLDHQILLDQLDEIEPEEPVNAARYAAYMKVLKGAEEPVRQPSTAPKVTSNG